MSEHTVFATRQPSPYEDADFCAKRKLQAQEAGRESGNRVEPTRCQEPAVETITFEAEVDATDQIEFPDQNPNAREFGIQPQPALSELLGHPQAAQLRSDDGQPVGELRYEPRRLPVWVGGNTGRLFVTEELMKQKDRCE